MNKYFVVAQIILLSQWFSTKELSKKTNKKNPSQNNRDQNNLFKMILWSHRIGDKKTIWKIFLTKFLNQFFFDFL
jgi:hypothetical protein